MKLQHTLLSTATIALLMLSGCATATSAQTAEEDVLAGGKHSKMVKIIEMKDGHKWITHDGSDSKAFVFKSGDGHMAMDMDVDVQTDENGETIVTINGEKVDGDIHEWVNKDGKKMKLHVKSMKGHGKDGKMLQTFLAQGDGESVFVINGDKGNGKTHKWMSKDGKKLKRRMKKLHKLHAQEDGKNIFIFKDGKGKDGKKLKALLKNLHADAGHSQIMLKQLEEHMGELEGLEHAKKFVFIGSDDGESPHMMTLEDGMKVFIADGGLVKIMKDGKVVEADGSNVTINKTVTMEEGKRKTKIVIEMVDDE